MNDPALDDTMREPTRGDDLGGRTVAGRYHVLRLIGQGGMGAVYEAENLSLGKRVAIKFVDPELAKDDQVVSRFAREARAASAIESPNIVTVFDAGTFDGRPYLVMELLRGEDLGSRLRVLGRIPEAEMLHVAAQTLRGLASAHDAGILHRDLKPDNLFLVQAGGAGEAPVVKIVDFGVSKIEKPKGGTKPLALTAHGTVMGTPRYMAPEQAQAAPDLDARADLYSVGAILFECLSGRPPHLGASYEQIILSICTTDAPDLREVLPSVSPPLAALVGRALARNRDARFANARDMLAAVEALRVDQGRISAPPRASSAPRANAAVKPGPLARAAVPLIALVATLAGVVATFALVGTPRPRPSPPPSAALPVHVSVPVPAPDSAAPAPPPIPTAPLPSASALPLAPRPSAHRAPPSTAVPHEPPPPRSAAPPVLPPPAAAPTKTLDISRELP